MHGGPVGAVLVAAAHPAGRGHRAGLGHPGQFEREVTVRSVPGRRLRDLFLAGSGYAAGPAWLAGLDSWPGTTPWPSVSSCPGSTDPAGMAVT